MGHCERKRERVKEKEKEREKKKKKEDQYTKGKNNGGVSFIRSVLVESERSSQELNESGTLLLLTTNERWCVMMSMRVCVCMCEREREREHVRVNEECKGLFVNANAW